MCVPEHKTPPKLKIENNKPRNYQTCEEANKIVSFLVVPKSYQIIIEQNYGFVKRKISSA
jgi:hypothetical protein